MIEAKTSRTSGAKAATGKPLSESEFLRVEAEDARAAATRAIANAQAALVGAVDPRNVTKAHPFIAVGSAAAVGFFAALLTIPSKQEQALRRIEKLHRATHPTPPAPPKDSNGAVKPPAQSFWMILLKEAIAVLKPILIASITAGLNNPANPPAQPAAGASDNAP
jgi:ElaB/YqjD/DUF883 family membrane-anchored ribosome-binding protein